MCYDRYPPPPIPPNFPPFSPLFQTPNSRFSELVSSVPVRAGAGTDTHALHPRRRCEGGPVPPQPQPHHLRHPTFVQVSDSAPLSAPAEGCASPFTAPEVMDGDAPWGPAVDVYAAAMVAWSMLSGGVPWADCTAAQLRRRVCAHRARPAVPSPAPPPLRRFMEWAWEADPKARPTAVQALWVLDGDQPLPAPVPSVLPEASAVERCAVLWCPGAVPR